MIDRRVSLAAWTQEISLLPDIQQDHLGAIRRQVVEVFLNMPPVGAEKPLHTPQYPGSIAAVMYAALKAGMSVDDMLRLDTEVLVQKAAAYEEFIHGESTGHDPDDPGSG